MLWLNKKNKKIQLRILTWGPGSCIICQCGIVSFALSRQLYQMIAVILYDYFKLPVTNNRSPLVCKGHRELVIHSNTTKGQCL